MATCKAHEATPVTTIGYTLELTPEEANYLATLLYCGIGHSGVHPIGQILRALRNSGAKPDSVRDRLKCNKFFGYAYFD